MKAQLGVFAAGLVLATVSACGGGDSDDDVAATPPSAPPWPSTPAPPPGVLVTDVVDGDTIKVQDGRTVRIIGIDAPESVAPNASEGCFGPEASAFATATLLGERVTLTPDPTQDAFDVYGRTLAYVDLSGGRDYSVLAVESGHGYAYIYDTEPARFSSIKVAEGAAKLAGRGVWSPTCVAPTPPPPPRPSPVAPRQLYVAPEPVVDEPSGDCEPGYDPCVPSYPPDLDCGDLDGPYQVTGSDPHRLDREGDGLGCESG